VISHPVKKCHARSGCPLTMITLSSEISWWCAKVTMANHSNHQPTVKNLKNGWPN